MSFGGPGDGSVVWLSRLGHLVENRNRLPLSDLADVSVALGHARRCRRTPTENRRDDGQRNTAFKHPRYTCVSEIVKTDDDLSAFLGRLPRLFP